MRCTKAKRLINDYIDGNLNEKHAVSLKQHLHRCDDCNKLLKDLQKIVSSAIELETLSPPSEVWHKIEAKLKEKTQTTKASEFRKRWLFSPAVFRYGLISVLLLVIAISVTIIVPHYLKKDKSEINQQEYVLAKLKEAEHHYQLAIKALQEAISSQKGSLDPRVASALQENLSIINASINACKKAVLLEPYNLEVRNYLLYAYQQKVNFLNEIINYSQGNLESIL